MSPYGLANSFISCQSFAVLASLAIKLLTSIIKTDDRVAETVSPKSSGWCERKISSLTFLCLGPAYILSFDTCPLCISYLPILQNFCFIVYSALKSHSSRWAASAPATSLRLMGELISRSVLPRQEVRGHIPCVCDKCGQHGPEPGQYNSTQP